MNALTQIMPNRYQYAASVRNLPIEPISRTYQYRKIMKPMLERKRRARINKCLDELKDLMTTTLQADSENVSKLEKADILEMTVQHLQQLRKQKTLFLYNQNSAHTQKFWDGFQRCAAEVAQFLQKHDQNINCDLIQNLATNYQNVPQLSAFQHQQSASKLKPHKQLSFCLQDNCQTLASTQMSKIITTTKHDQTDVWRPWR